MKLYLVHTWEYQITAKVIELTLLDVSCIIIFEIRGGKTEIDNINDVGGKDVGVYILYQLLHINIEIQEEVVQLQVIENETSLVHFLKDIKKLDAEGVDGFLGEACILCFD